MKSSHKYFLVAAVISAALTQNASAQPGVIEPFRACAAILDNAARLTCFDLAVQTGESLVAREQQRTREDFGLTEFRREQLARGEQGPARTETVAPVPEPEPTRITAKVDEVLRDGASRRIFLLANGQLWRQLANTNFRGEIGSGETVIIQRGTLTGFRLTVDRRPGFIGVRRVR